MKNLFSLTLVGVLASAASAQTIALWNFNTNNATPQGTTASPNTVTGVGVASLVGGTSATFASGNANGGSTDPETTTADSGWNLTTYAAQGTGSGTRGAQFAIPTTGVLNSTYTFSMDLRYSNSVSKFFAVSYTTNGTTFTPLGQILGTAGDTWTNGSSFTINDAAANNNALFAVRVLSVFAPSTTQYATSGVAAYATTGTSRFDMVRLSAAPVPEPASMAVLGLGLAALKRRRNAKK